MEQTSTGAAPTLANYQLRLQAFEGPLDVLLRLIERNRLAIEDVSLVAVTDQFLAYVQTLDEAEPAVVAEFAAVGARLTVLKSRSLLPRPVADAEEPEPSDLTLQLREYRRIKELAVELGTQHARGEAAFAPGTPGAIVHPPGSQLSRLMQHDAGMLVRALRRRLTVIPRLPEVIRQRRVVSIREAVDRIVETVSRTGTTRFSRIVAPYVTRTEVATAFLAVLVLIRRDALEATQDGLYTDIRLDRAGDARTDIDQPVDEFLN